VQFEDWLARRVVLIASPITARVAEETIAKLLFLESEAADVPLHLVLDSPGGLVAEAVAIRDAMDHVRCPIHVHVLKLAGGVAAILLAHGRRGERAAIADAKVMLAPLGHGSSAELAKTESLLADLLASDTGQSAATILEDMRASRVMSAEEALAYGLIDRIADPPWPSS